MKVKKEKAGIVQVLSQQKDSHLFVHKNIILLSGKMKKHRQKTELREVLFRSDPSVFYQFTVLSQ